MPPDLLVPVGGGLPNPPPPRMQTRFPWMQTPLPLDADPNPPDADPLPWMQTPSPRMQPPPRCRPTYPPGHVTCDACQPPPLSLIFPLPVD